MQRGMHLGGLIAALFVTMVACGGDDDPGATNSPDGGTDATGGTAGTGGAGGQAGTGGASGQAGAGGEQPDGGAGQDAGTDAAQPEAGTDASAGAAGADAGTDASAGAAGVGGAAGASPDGGIDASGGADAGDAGNPVCDDADKLCNHTFSYAHGNETSVEVRGDFQPNGWNVGVPMTLQGNVWTATLQELPWGTDFQYKFVIDGSQWIPDPSNPNTVSDGYGGLNSVVENLTCGTWTCDTTVAPVNDWGDEVMYFVFVDRFLDGDATNNAPVSTETAANWQGGDWAGVRTKVEEGYFNDLGVTALWLSAPMDNTNSTGVGDDGHDYSAYHGYWPSALEQTEEHFGTLAELTALVDAAHARGLRVVVDYVMNHVHIDSSVYANHNDWFWPLDNCVCGEGCSWEGAEGKRCWFRDYLPDFNFTNQAARDYSVDNAVWWIEQTGADGFRLDAVKHIEDQWMLDLRQRVTAEIEPGTGRHFYMVGETFTGDRNTIKYYVRPDMLDGQFEFPLRLKLINTLLTRTEGMQSLDTELTTVAGFYGSDAIMSNFVGNHDVPRSIHFAQDNPISTDAWYSGKDRAWSNQPALPSTSSAFERLGNAFTVLYTIPGIPLVYYGDEIGLPGAGDPDNRRMMQWSGLSANQEALRTHLSKLGAIRQNHEALRHGTRTTLSVSNDVLVYEMVSGTDTVYVAINRGDSTQSATGLPASAMQELLSGQVETGPSVSLPPRSAKLFVLN